MEYLVIGLVLLIIWYKPKPKRTNKDYVYRKVGSTWIKVEL